MSRVLFFAALGLFVVACCSPSPEPDAAELFLLPAKGGYALPPEAEEAAVALVEVAADDYSRQRGLMFRDELAPDTGMLFIYPGERVRSFWMKNTRIPLSIAYADRVGHIVRIADMAPGVGVPDERLPRYSSERAATYALEMELGWFEAHGIRAGDRLVLHPALQAVRAR